MKNDVWQACDTVQQLAGGEECSREGWGNYDCMCSDGSDHPQTGAQATTSAPTPCTAACDVPGPLWGYACAAVGGTGRYTTCDHRQCSLGVDPCQGTCDVSGDPCTFDADCTNPSDTECTSSSPDCAVDDQCEFLACDEDSDCTAGSCSLNPTHCTAGAPNDIGQECAANADCDTTPGQGDGLCGDACPGGRCVALCVQEGHCSGGTRDGGVCGSTEQCPDGACAITDPEEGVCAAGPIKYRCNGEGYRTQPCTAADLGTTKRCEDGTDGIPGTQDDLPGAGICVQMVKECHYNRSWSEGGDTLNGLGDPTDYFLVAVSCVPPSPSPTANEISGFGGPWRVRRWGVVAANFTSISSP